MLLFGVAFFYFYQNSNIFIPDNSKLFLIVSGSKFEKIFSGYWDKQFLNLKNEKFFYMGSGQKAYGEKKLAWKIYGDKSLFSQKNSNYFLQNGFGKIEDGAYDTFLFYNFSGDYGIDNIILKGKQNDFNIQIFQPSSHFSSGFLVVPEGSEIYFSWHNLKDFGGYQYLQDFVSSSEYFSGFNSNDKTQILKIFSYPGTIAISGNKISIFSTQNLNFLKQQKTFEIFNLKNFSQTLNSQNISGNYIGDFEPKYKIFFTQDILRFKNINFEGNLYFSGTILGNIKIY